MEKRYTLEIWKRIKRRIEMRFGTRRATIISIAIPLILNVIAYVVFYRLWDLNTANQQILGFFIGTILVEAALLGAFIFSWRFYDVPEEIYSEQGKFIESLASEQLNLFVSQGGHIFENASDGIPRIYLLLDVVNMETRKIIDVEARFTQIDQWTEKHPDDRTESNGYFSYRTQRLQWQNGSSVIDLTPGFPETKLKIAVLYCYVPEFMFIHEGVLKPLPELQTNSLFRVVIELKGKLEGPDPSYKFFHHEVEFICLPKDCKLDFLPEAAKFPDIPKGIQGKIRKDV